MKSLIRIYFYLAVLVALMAACKNETDEIKEEIAEAAGKPSGSISVLLPGSAAWNDVEVKVNASHPNGKIAIVELFADGQLVAADNEAPYTFSWDTRPYEDGEVQLMARITDELDNFIDLTTKVEVKNTLMDFELHNQFFPLDPNFKYFVFLTGTNRETLFFEKVEKLPYTKTIKRPEGYNSETMLVSFVHANGLKAKLITFHEVTAGKFVPVSESLKGSKLGDGNVKFTNIPAHEYFRFGETGGDLLLENKLYKTDIYQNSNTGYLYLRNGAQGSYKILKDLTLAEKEVSLQDMNSVMKYFKIDLPEVLEGAVYKVDAHLGPEINAPDVNLFYTYKFGEMEDFKINFHIPADAPEFHHLSSSFNIIQNGKSYLNKMFNGLIKTPEYLNVDFSVKSHTLEEIDITLSGEDYDVLRSIWELDANGYIFSWESYSENSSIAFPPIPTALTSAFPKFTSSSIVFKNATVTMQALQYDHLNSYADYIHKISGRDGKPLEAGGQQYRGVMQTFKP
jgi:hypothetical protein